LGATESEGAKHSPIENGIIILSMWGVNFNTTSAEMTLDSSASHLRPLTVNEQTEIEKIRNLKSMKRTRTRDT
jgi:hypothetical protein